MIWLIVRKEILNNIMTLRFALITILLLILMVMNALIYTFGAGGYASGMKDYRSRIAESLSWVEKFSNLGLGELAMAGVGSVPKLPSRLKFCADGNDELIPRHVGMGSSLTRSRGGGMGVEGYAWRRMWSLNYPQNIIVASRFIKIDWVFVGIIMSFGAIWFTFDAISGERERGTLRLMLSNSVSRAQVLSGKFLGAFFSIMLPLSAGILINLLIINFSGAVSLDYSDWIRLAGMVVLFALHISVFILLGIFISSRASHSITSLVILLLSWVFFVFLLPNAIGLFVSNLKQISSIEEISWRREALLNDIEDKFQPFPLFSSTGLSTRLPRAPSPENPQSTRQWAKYLTEIAETEARINDQHLDEQLGQVQLSRSVTQVSPIATFQYAMEALAGTGIESYISFVKQVRRYRQEFIDFIKSQDGSDPESLHIYGVREGLSQKPVDPDNVPKFKERITYESAFYYIILLIVFNLLFFMAAHISFLKCDIK